MFIKKKLLFLLSVILTILFLMPLLSLMVQGFLLDISVVKHFIYSNIYIYIGNTIKLVILVILISSLIAIPTAYILSRYTFFCSGLLQVLLCLPLAIPSYLSAYVFTDLFDYAGIVQKTIRVFFNWTVPSDYYFPSIRSMGGAALILSFCLYPYIFLVARSSFMLSHDKLINSSRILGSSYFNTIVKIVVPLARPSIIVGISLVTMETIGDYGAVSFFSIHTVTTAIYDAWLGLNDLGSASILSIMLLLFIVILVLIEAFYRRKQRFYSKNESVYVVRRKLSGYKSIIAFSLCFFIFLIAFIIPFSRLLYWAIINFWENINLKFFKYIYNSLLLSLSSSFVCLIIALFLQLSFRSSKIRNDAYKKFYNISTRSASFGYSIPGVVLAIGIMMPLIYADFFINWIWALLAGDKLGLIFSGSIFALIFAYTIRFSAMAQGTISSGLENINPNIDMASINLGVSGIMTFIKVHLPILKTSMLTSFLLVFIESMKELNATLLLRPFNFDTLSTHLYTYTSDELLEHSALSAVILILISTIPTIILTLSLLNNNSKRG